LLPFALLSALFATSCLVDSSGPALPLTSFTLAPAYPAATAGIVDIDRVRVVLVRLKDESTAVDTIVQVAPGAESLDITLQVTLQSDSEQFLLTLTLITAAGDAAFEAGPFTVTAATGSSQTEPLPIEINFIYVGIGANAAAVQITSENVGVALGDTVVITAVALDSAGAPIPGTPIAWSSLDPQRAQVPDPRTGRVIGGPERGPARIVATLLTGQADTITIGVGAQATALLVVSGNNQSALVGTRLDFPVVIQVVGPDELGVPGILVEFSTEDGGSFSPAAAISDTFGLVATLWTLGPELGPQTGIAAAAGLQAMLSATGEAAPTAGRDVVVFNDINIFDDPAMANPNNRLFIRNLVNFDTPGPRNDGTTVIFDRGRSSSCGGACGDASLSIMRSIIADSVGMTIVDDNSVTGSITSIPNDVKVIFLMLPIDQFTDPEIDVLKQFSADGGRIVFVGEHDGFYGTGIPTENQFLIDMGAQMTNTGGAVDCGRITLPGSSLRQEHQIMDGLTDLDMGCASVIDPGPQDFALFYDTSNTLLLAGVAKVDVTQPLYLLRAEALRRAHAEPGIVMQRKQDPALVTSSATGRRQ
jgi:hypothetical protein